MLFLPRFLYFFARTPEIAVFNVPKAQDIDLKHVFRSVKPLFKTPADRY